MTTKTIKQVDTNLTKVVKEFYTYNYKMSLRDINK